MGRHHGGGRGTSGRRAGIMGDSATSPKSGARLQPAFIEDRVKPASAKK